MCWDVFVSRAEAPTPLNDDEVDVKMLYLRSLKAKVTASASTN